MSDKFTGRWLVTEYVHHPNGDFLGIVHQKRRVEEINGRLMVIQDCDVSPELGNHPMKSFAGHWEFEIKREGRLRYYLGEDVVGMGRGWGDKLITGQGIWTRFGHNFKSFSYLVSPERQLTGGTFYNANEPIAVIIGVACPEKEDALEAWASLDLEAIPPKKLRGKTYRYNMQGELIAEGEYLPQPSDIYKRYSCYSESHAYSPSQFSESQFIVDNENCLEIRRIFDSALPSALELSLLHTTGK